MDSILKAGTSIRHRQQKSRLSWLDTVKALGIYFVYLGHTTWLNIDLKNYIYSFHMPLFFFLAGLFFKDKYLDYGYIDFIKSKFKKRMIPYLAFGGVSYLLWLILYYLKEYGIYQGVQSNIHPLKPLLGMLYGVGSKDWLPHNGSLWFLVCLFITEVIFFTLRKNIYQKRKFALIVLLLSVSGAMIHVIDLPRIPFSLDSALVALGFYTMAYLYKSKIIDIKFNAWLAFVLFLVGTYLSYMNGRVDMNSNIYGNSILYFISALCSIIFWIQISKRFIKIQIVQYVGINSLAIFLMQPPIYVFMSGLMRFGFNYKVSFEINSIYSIGYALFGILIALPLTYILNHKTFKFIGRKV